MPRPDPPGILYLSASGLHRLLVCEQKFLYQRVEDDFVPGDALQLGTLLHRMVGAWWLDGTYEAEYVAALTEEEGWTPEWEPPAKFEKAQYVMERYATVYEKTREDWTCLATEVPFDLPLIPGVRVRGYLDALFRDSAGRVWVVEFKSMSRWNRMDWVSWDPQVWLYAWAGKSIGIEMAGFVLDALSTYKYVADRPAIDSFRQVVVPWDAEKADVVLDAYRRGAVRALDIIARPATAMKNIGDTCTWCPFAADCLGPLLAVPDLEA